MKDCLFCKIASGEIPAKIMYRDDEIVAFDDINPQAPHHKIIIPQKHIATLNDLHDEDSDLIGHAIKIGVMLAKQLGIADEGYRLVFNCNAGAGQSVFHVHLHLLGGRRLSWPPG
ncbi:MAG: histidine triad nucleotide-binding protein [Gammaproteobacteria bacterium RIFCSPHIGHO2_12_FULL_37_14]|nr:MAG: histidine triad nucleotide-binding protein [Gammaproteobacteria bacterium RIFCSPHIGHO2_12_FULL_37_14]